MARKKTPDQLPAIPLRLVLPGDITRQKIAERIAKGTSFLQNRIDSPEILKNLRGEYSKWSEYNTDLLKQLFSDERMADEYSKFCRMFSLRVRSFPEEVEEFKEDVRKDIRRLESISDRIELYPMAETVTELNIKQTHDLSMSSKVFIVHGHDEAARETVARFLGRLEIEPIILHEQASGGKTLIEKLEHYSDVGFAVVLMTPDDEGRGKIEGEPYRDRTRQNVLLELGYFIHKLGRQRVCALHCEGVEIPTDYLGVVYVPFDRGGGWQLRLAKELKEVGFNIDMNKI